MNNPGGGAERVLTDVASGLVARGYEVAVLSFDLPGGDSYYPLNEKIQRIELGIGSTSSPATALGTLKRIVAMRSRIRKYSPDVAVGFMHSMFIPLGLALLGTSIPMIGSEHIVWHHYRSRPLQRLLMHLAPFLTKRITCVSEQALVSYPPRLRQKMVVVANPVSVQGQGRADVAGSRRPRKILLTVGRLAAQKDHATLIEAFAAIADRLPDWDLRIVGEGELRPTLESMIAGFGLTERVLFPGATKDIVAEYLSAQLFVLPSSYESFGLTAAEALAHGLPAVCFDDCPGVNNLIRPGVNGDFADGKGNRAASLAETLHALMKDDALRVGLAEESKWTPDKNHLQHILDSWEKLFGEAKKISGRTPANS